MLCYPTSHVCMCLKFTFTILSLTQEPCIFFFLLCLIGDYTLLIATTPVHPIATYLSADTSQCFALTIKIVGEAVMKNNLAFTGKLFLYAQNAPVENCVTSNCWRKHKNDSFLLCDSYSHHPCFKHTEL